MAKAKASGIVYQLKITLRDIKPPVWRRVQVKDCTLAKLHDIIQAVMGWRDYHLFEFQIGQKLYGLPDPPDDYGRKVLHAKLAKLEAVIAKGIRRFEYLYDFGDDWEHLIDIESIATGDLAVKYPRFVDGARRGPPKMLAVSWATTTFSTPLPMLVTGSIEECVTGMADLMIHTTSGYSTCACGSAKPTCSQATCFTWSSTPAPIGGPPMVRRGR